MTFLIRDERIGAFNTGDSVEWKRVSRNGYGLVTKIKAKVIRVTAARVRILLDDGTQRSVSPLSITRASP